MSVQDRQLRIWWIYVVHFVGCDLGRGVQLMVVAVHQGNYAATVHNKASKEVEKVKFDEGACLSSVSEDL